jgi:F0F1-type ATP synthase assembly protein I
MVGPWKAAGRYGAVGIELVLAVVVTAAIGQWLDRRYWGSHGWGLMAGVLLGFAAGLRNLMRSAQSMQRDIEREEADNPQAGRWIVDQDWVHKPPEESTDDSSKPDRDP